MSVVHHVKVGTTRKTRYFDPHHCSARMSEIRKLFPAASSIAHHYWKRGSASYCALGALGERERYRDRERERDGSDVTLVALKLAMNFAPFLAKTLKLAMNFAPFLAKNFHLSIGEEFCTFPCQKFAP